MKTTVLLRRLTVLSLMSLVWTSAACGSHKSSGTKQANLSGVVRSEAGQPVSGATVASSAQGLSATTDASGKYSFETTADQLATLTVRANAYALMSRQVASTAETQDFTLRAIDLEQTVSLPTGTDPALELNVQRSGAKLAVTIPPDVFVTANGNVATGQATVKISFWNPNESLLSSPAELRAHSNDANDVDGLSDTLESFGMFDITVEQSGAELQVGPNQLLPIAQTMNTEIAGYAAANSNAGVNNFMFYLDPTTRGWRLAADTTLDPSTGKLSAELPHLSSWNFDRFDCPYPAHCSVNDILGQRNGCVQRGDCASSMGGCIQGTIKDSKGNPVVGQGTLWLFSQEGIYNVTVPTDSSGHFCYNAGLRVVPNSGAAGPPVTSNSLPNHTSALHNAKNSALPNPITSDCLNMDGQYADQNRGNQEGKGVKQWRGQECGYVDNTFANIPARHKPATTLDVTTVNLCAFCPGTAPARCPYSSIKVTNNCGTAGTPGGGTACAKQLKLGDACDTNSAACCPLGTVCADGICVPEKD